MKISETQIPSPEEVDGLVKLLETLTNEEAVKMFLLLTGATSQTVASGVNATPDAEEVPEFVLTLLHELFVQSVAAFAAVVPPDELATLLSKITGGPVVSIGGE